MSGFEISRLADGSGLRLVGELDVATAPELAKALLDESLEGSSVILDLSELTFVDSCGMHVILSLASSMNGRGPLVVLDPTEPVTRVFEILGLDEHPAIEVRRKNGISRRSRGTRTYGSDGTRTRDLRRDRPAF